MGQRRNNYTLHITFGQSYAPLTSMMYYFYIKVKQSNGISKKYIIEVKPKKQCSPPNPKPTRKTRRWFSEVKTWAVNEAKWKSANSWCENNGMEFKILTEDDLGIRYK